jgi:hypothetical protein
VYGRYFPQSGASRTSGPSSFSIFVVGEKRDRRIAELWRMKRRLVIAGALINDRKMFARRADHRTRSARRVT